MSHKTKDKGDIAVATVILDLTQKGYKVFTPSVTEHCKYDLIVDTGEKLYRIQVKHRDDGYLSPRTSWSDTNGHHETYYKDNDFDYYALYLPHTNKVYYPSIKFKGCSISWNVPVSATPFYWHEDFLNFTNEATRKTYKDFGLVIKRDKKTNKPFLQKQNTEIDILISEENIKLPRRPIQELAFSRRKVNRPSKDDLQKMLWEEPTTKIAAKFGVSDKAIEKWAIRYGLTKPPRGYWAKLEHNKK